MGSHRAAQDPHAHQPGPPPALIRCADHHGLDARSAVQIVAHVYRLSVQDARRFRATTYQSHPEVPAGTIVCLKLFLGLPLDIAAGNELTAARVVENMRHSGIDCSKVARHYMANMSTGNESPNYVLTELCDRALAKDRLTRPASPAVHGRTNTLTRTTLHEC